jgi:hypothetical protein
VITKIESVSTSGKQTTRRMAPSRRSPDGNARDVVTVTLL